MTLKERAADTAKIRTRYLQLGKGLTERARRLFAASEAIAFGAPGMGAEQEVKVLSGP